MELAASYPKIFSLSTVGIRHHFNQDYLFHLLRTDFTGDNGVGKSIIGDLLQLILVARRNAWRSGTEGMDKDKRKIETMPLPDHDLQFAYAFLNIERAQGKFVTVGVWISSHSTQNVKPFIIQKGGEFSATAALLSFEKPIMAKDFINGDTILNLDELKGRLFDDDLYLQEFTKGDKIKDYHKLLFQNDILPVDLSLEANLTMYANVLQSFSRAKSLEITKSASLKNFIFPAQHDTLKHFEDSKTKLAEYIKGYHSLEKQRKGIEDKQKSLTQLKELERKKDQARANFLEAQALLSWQQLRKAESDLKRFEAEMERLKADIEAITTANERLETELTKAKADREVNHTDRDILGKIINFETQKEFYKSSIQSETSTAQKVEKQVAEAKEKFGNSKETLSELERSLPSYQTSKEHFEAEKERQRIFLEPLELLHKAVEKFGRIESLEKAIAEREAHEHEATMLRHLEDMPNGREIENSACAQKGHEAIATTEERLRVLDLQIPQLEGLAALYDRENHTSLFSWAVKQKNPLTIAQETVLMHLKEILVEQAPEIENAQYTLTPASLFEGIKETKSGVWLTLGPIYRFLPFVTKQMFDQPAQLGALIDKGKIEIEQEITNLMAERAAIVQLRNSLNKIGFNDAHFRCYRKRSEIKTWKEPEGLPTKLQWETWLPLATELENIAHLRTVYGDTVERWKTHNELFISTKLKIDTAKSEIDQSQKRIQEFEEQIQSLERSISKGKTELTNVEVSILGLWPKLSFRLEANAARDKIQEQLEEDRKNLSAKISEGDETVKKNNQDLSIHAKRQGTLEGDLAGANDRLRSSTSSFEKHSSQFQEELNQQFMPETLQYKVDQEDVNVRLNTSNSTLAEYHANFNQVVSSYEEAGKSERVKFDQYDFRSLEEVLLGSKIKHLDKIGSVLAGLNEELRQIAEGHWTMVIDVFKYVERKYKESKDTITRLNHFFDGTVISRNYIIELAFRSSDRLNIEWIEKMRKATQDRKMATGLFAGTESISPEAIIQNLAATFCGIKNVDIKHLLDEKQYFDLKLNLKGKTSDQQFGGSHGQSYMAISLLCIGRLSIVEAKGKDSRPGIRFLIVEELANLDENNFSMFPRLAKEFGYQMITMTPKPFAGFTEAGAFIHMLSPGKGGSLINMPPYSILMQDGVHVEIEKYLAAKNGLESA